MLRLKSLKKQQLRDGQFFLDKQEKVCYNSSIKYNNIEK